MFSYRRIFFFITVLSLEAVSVITLLLYTHTVSYVHTYMHIWVLHIYLSCHIYLIFFSFVETLFLSCCYAVFLFDACILFFCLGFFVAVFFCYSHVVANMLLFLRFLHKLQALLLLFVTAASTCLSSFCQSAFCSQCFVKNVYVLYIHIYFMPSFFFLY